ncbi:MAG: sugar ABC transporter ATP-binding protein [Thermoprotei archaeon]|nr:MAG: sugar ABC transporter ATP-binding protein [Thermoprotei archaeon]
MVRVKLINLTKIFGKVIAVDHINLTISDGEFVALLGPSGCGKTTTLLLIAGIYKPTKGEIYFDDKLVNDLDPKDRNVGMVFQSYALYPHMSVYDNIAFPLKLKKIPKNEIDKKVKEVAKFLHIEELLSRKPFQLSGGQQQRVALARALVKEPDIFLLDEPLSNLDAKLRIEMRAELKRLQKELGITTIYVTHDQVEAMTMADRIAVMNRGRIMQVGTPDDLYNKPVNTFVAGFIGSPPMNLFEADLKTIGNEVYIEAAFGKLKITHEALRNVLMEKAGTSRVIVGIRPEDIIVGNGDLEGEIYAIEPLGRELLIDIRVGDQLIRALTSPSFRGIAGERIRFTFNYDKIHIFRKDTGKAIV